MEFILFYLWPLTSTLQAIDEATKAMNTTLISSIIKIMMMIVLLPIPNLNIYGLVIAVLFNVVFVTVWHYLLVRKYIGYRLNLNAVINAVLIIGITFLLGSYLKSTIIFSPNTLLNMIIICFIMGIAYLFLVIVCGLFPKDKMVDTLRSK